MNLSNAVNKLLKNRDEDVSADFHVLVCLRLGRLGDSPGREESETHRRAGFSADEAALSIATMHCEQSKARIDALVVS